MICGLILVYINENIWLNLFNFLGQCICDDGFGTSDCSVNLRAPPEVFGLGGDGVCDISQQPCQIVSVYGSNLLDTASLTCKVTKKKASF